MLLLLLRVGEERYGLNASQIVEVVPLVHLKRIPQAPDYIAGLFDYRGQPVPVIDLCHLGTEQICKRCMTTRIIMLDCGQANGHRQILGLLAEQVTETIKQDPEALISISTPIAEAPWLGQRVKDSEGMLQLIEVSGLLPKAFQERVRIL